MRVFWEHHNDQDLRFAVEDLVLRIASAHEQQGSTASQRTARSTCLRQCGPKRYWRGRA